MNLYRDIALEYAAHGLAVFPLRPGSKAPHGRLVRNGHKEASVDEVQIRAWWRDCPDAGIGIACTATSGFLALDIDPRNGGDFYDLPGELPEAPIQLTGGGGWHVLFRHPLMRFRRQVGRGLDVKAEGYIVAAPTRVNGHANEYAWDVSPFDTPIPAAPAWLCAIGVKLEAATPEPVGDVAGSVLARMFAAAGLVGRQIDNRRLCVVCPWEHLHSTAGTDSGTIVLAPTEQAPDGTFWCSHESCGRPSYRDVTAALLAHVRDIA